jgi:pimeloyl-ACP methyl ester carboxylesterase
MHLHYEEYGQGEPLVLLHGLGSSSQDWELQVPALSRHYRVILMDIRGHGRSDKPASATASPPSAPTCWPCSSTCTGPVHFVGLSMGGMIGFQLAVDHPQWLRSLCIVNSAPEVKRRTRSDWAGGSSAGAWRACSVSKPSARAWPPAVPQTPAGRTAAKMAERWARNDKRAYLKSFDAIVDWGVQERIGQITVLPWSSPPTTITPRYN